MTGPDARQITTRIEQRSPALTDVEANAATVRRAVEDARDDGVNLLVFPELFLTGYHVTEGDPEALTADAAEALDELAPLTDGLTVVVGAPVEEEGDRYNSAAVLSDGARLGAYHKTHLYGDEHDAFVPGDSFPVFETDACDLGVQVCYDAEFPEPARQLTLGGAEVIVTIFANMHPFEDDQTIYHRARAIENVRPHVVCNRVGTECGVDFFGKSGVVNARGEDVLVAGEDVSASLTADVELGAEGASSLRYLRDRRPDIYARE